MALRAAKQLYPEIEFHLIVRDSFAELAQKVDWIDQVIVLPTAALLSPLVNKHRGAGLKELAQWLKPHVQSYWDFVINWTYSDASSYLTAILPGRVKAGLSRGSDNQITALDGWSHYIQGIVQQKVSQDIHITDILTTQLLTLFQIHLGDPADHGNAAVTSRNFFTLNQKDTLDSLMQPQSRKWIAFQLGATREEHSWSPQSWAKLASLILSTQSSHSGYKIILLGKESDSVRLQKFWLELERLGDHFRKDIVSLVGKTDFDLWAGAIGRCNWLFSTNTSAIHLASLLGTRIVALLAHDARLTNAGPYGNGHYVLSPIISTQATQAIPPECVYATWEYGSNEWLHRRQSGLTAQFGRHQWQDLISQVHIYRSRIRAGDEGGGVIYEPQIQRHMQVSDWTAQFVGYLARAWYCGWVPPIAGELARERLSPELVRSLRELGESSEVLAKICTEGKRIAEGIIQKAKKLKSPTVMDIETQREFRDLGVTLQDLDSLIERMGRTHPALRVFSNMSRILMHNLDGDQIHEMGRSSIQAYDQILRGANLLEEWVKHTLQLAKPVALQTANVIPLKEISP